jgi:DNA-binding CsgD family transcriptional regulator
MRKLVYGILTNNEYQSLNLRLKKNKTFEEIANELKLSSRSNAYSTFKNAIRKLEASKKLSREFKI